MNLTTNLFVYWYISHLDLILQAQEKEVVVEDTADLSLG